MWVVGADALGPEVHAVRERHRAVLLLGEQPRRVGLACDRPLPQLQVRVILPERLRVRQRVEHDAVREVRVGERRERFAEVDRPAPPRVPVLRKTVRRLQRVRHAADGRRRNVLEVLRGHLVATGREVRL